MPKKLEDTSRRITQRKYEERQKEKRKQTSCNFQAMMPRATFEEINEYIKEKGITKVQLVVEGYNALKAKDEKK